MYKKVSSFLIGFGCSLVLLSFVACALLCSSWLYSFVGLGVSSVGALMDALA